MKKTIFESDIFAIDAKGVFPFKIIVEKEESQSYEEITVYKDSYNVVEGKEIVERQLLSGTMWKNKENS